MARELVLVVDDEFTLREVMKQVLSKHFEVILAANGKMAIELARKHKPKVILLDISMPEMDGVEVCTILRNDPLVSSAHFIMVTALNDSIQRTAAFHAGADDYLEKPFRPEELIARVNSKLRRIQDTESIPSEKTIGNVKLNFSKMCLNIAGAEQVKVGVTELKILNTLVNAGGKIVTRKDLVADVWSPGSDRVVDPHITSLRKKLSNSNVEIKTVYGEGYSVIVKS